MFFSAAEIGGVTGPLTIGALYDATGGFSASLTTLTAITMGLMLIAFSMWRNEQRASSVAFSVAPEGGTD
jgi:cyanate permease